MSFWRKDQPVLEETQPGRFRVVKGGMWVPQLKWWELRNFIRLLVAGYGFGKSEILCKWAVAMALQNSPCWGALVSPSFPVARRTIIPTMERLLEGKSSVRSDFTWRHNKADHAFTLTLEGLPPATILYLSGDDPTSLKGPNLAFAGIDEPFIQEYAVFEQMVSRCRDPRAKMIALGMTGTPEQLNWGYELAEGELRSRYDVGYVTASTRENRVLPKEYADRLEKGFDPKAAEAYLHGKFVNLSSGRVFYSFSREKNVKAGVMNTGVSFVGMDFNVNPMAMVVGWHSGTRCHIYAEYELPNSDTEYAAALVRERHPEVRIAFPDPTGKRRQTNSPGGMSDFKWLQRAGFIVLAPTEPWGRRDSYNSVNKKYSTGELTVDPSCKKLISYLEQHTHEMMNKQEAMTHLLDAHRYPVTYLFPAYKASSAEVSLIGA